MLGAWYLQESDRFAMTQKKAHDQSKTPPYRDEFGLFEILNINVSLDVFQRLYNNSNAQKEFKDRTLLIFTNTSDNILTGYQSSARDKESVGLDSVLYEHKDSLRQQVIINFSNSVQEIQIFVYAEGRIEHITRERKAKDSATFV
jgi:galactokinase/mevalonate kinase-like predicted kinase